MITNMLAQGWPEARLRRLRVRLVGQVLAGDSVRAVGNIASCLQIETPSGEVAQRFRVAVELLVEGRGSVVVGHAELESAIGDGT